MSRTNWRCSLSLLIFLFAFTEVRGTEMIEEGIATVNGTKLYYEIKGKGSPLVLISGGGTLDRRAWDNQFETFSKFYKVIRYDVRGIGKSARPVEQFSHSDDLYALLNFLKVKKAHVVGLSFSGAMALDFALDHPKSVDHLVLVASGASDDATSKENLDGLHFFSSMVKKEGIESAIQFVLNLSFFISPGNSAAHEKIRQIYTDNTDMFESDFPLVRLWRPTNPPASKRLSEIRAPVLILEGENDNPGYKAITAKLVSGISGVKKVVIPGGAHLLHLDKPNEFNQAVLDFLKK